MIATVKFSVFAGAVVRGQIKREIKRAAFQNGIECSLEEEKGWIESALMFTIKGDDDLLRRFVKAVHNFIEDNNE